MFCHPGATLSGTSLAVKCLNWHVLPPEHWKKCCYNSFSFPTVFVMYDDYTMSGKVSSLSVKSWCIEMNTRMDTNCVVCEPNLCTTERLWETKLIKVRNKQTACHYGWWEYLTLLKPGQTHTAVQSQKAASAYFTSKQMLQFGFAEQHSWSWKTGVFNVRPIWLPLARLCCDDGWGSRAECIGTSSRRRLIKNSSTTGGLGRVPDDQHHTTGPHS